MYPEEFVDKLLNNLYAGPYRKDYQSLIDLIKEPYNDINSVGRSGWTPLHCAIRKDKETGGGHFAFAKLFLLMGANPYCKRNDTTPKQFAAGYELMPQPSADKELSKGHIYIEFDPNSPKAFNYSISFKDQIYTGTISQTEIKDLIHEGPLTLYDLNRVIDQILEIIAQKSKIDFGTFFSQLPSIKPVTQAQKTKFRDAIKNTETAVVQEMLEQRYPYNDYEYSACDTCLIAAVKSGCFELVELLVRRGSVSQDKALHLWLKENSKNRPELQPIVQLLQLEKQKQIQMMEAFCAAPGVSAQEKLNASLQSIAKVQSNFDAVITGMKDQSSLNKMYQVWSEQILTQLRTHLHYPTEFTTACMNVVTLIAKAHQQNELKPTEALDLINKIEQLIDNPKQYKEFLKSGKNCQMVAGGRLSAYLMLIAGWAATIVSAGHWGDAYINLAKEKLERIGKIEQFAHEASAVSSKLQLNA